MPVYQQIPNFNVIFKQLPTPPTIINDLISASEEDRLQIKRELCTLYTSDMLSILPRCTCSLTQSEYALGTECPYCGTPVKNVVDDIIAPLLWLRKPTGVLEIGRASCRERV